jgi:hypothetical protein
MHRLLKPCQYKDLEYIQVSSEVSKMDGPAIAAEVDESEHGKLTFEYVCPNTSDVRFTYHTILRQHQLKSCS